MDIKKQTIVLPNKKEIHVDAINYEGKNYLGAMDLFTQLGYLVKWFAPKICLFNPQQNNENHIKSNQYTYEYKKQCHIVKIDPRNFHIHQIQAPKRSSYLLNTYKNYFNLDYFGGNPMYTVCNLAIDGKIISHTKTLEGANTAHKPQTTLYTTKHGTAGIIKTDDLTQIKDLDNAIGGVPFLINGEEVSLSRDIRSEGWSGGNFYRTWHTFITVQDGLIWLIGANVGHSNDVWATTVIANRLKSIGCTNTVIKMDGGGSFVFAKNGKYIASTSENRKINCIATFS